MTAPPPAHARPRVVVLSEWQTCVLGGVVLHPEDRSLAESLCSDSGGGRLGIDELRNGLRVTAKSWVGVVRFREVEVRVLPKLAGGDVGLLRLVDFAAGLDALDRHPAVRTFEAEGASLLDLIALLLAEATERVARAGLRADYREVEEDLPVVRGRLLVRRQVLQRFGRVDRLECRYDEHTTDTDDNRVLLAALAAAAPRVGHPAVALRVRRLHALLAEACTLDGFDPRAVRAALTYDRLNGHYREAHGLAWLVLGGLGVDDVYVGGGHRTFAFLLDMNRVFEDFVARWLGVLLKGTPYRAVAQRRDRTILWNADFDRPHGSVIPDLVVERRNAPGRFLPLDAKYKLYGDRPLAPADVYQTFMYAYAYGGEHAGLPTAIILFPSPTEATTTQRLHVRRADRQPSAEIVGLGVHLITALNEAVAGRAGVVGSGLVARIALALEGSSSIRHPAPAATSTAGNS